MKLYCVRHGVSAWTNEGRYTGVSDPELTDEGRMQAERLGAYLAGAAFDLAVSSPLRRCTETYERITPYLATVRAFRLDTRAREIHYGDWEGKTRAEIMAADPFAFRDWDEDPTRRPPPGGETVAAAAARIRALLADVSAQGAARALLISHRTILRILVATVLGMDLGQYRRRLDHAPAALTIIDLRAPNDGKLLLYNMVP